MPTPPTPARPTPRRRTSTLAVLTAVLTGWMVDRSRAAARIRDLTRQLAEANTDPVTGLPVRRLAEQWLATVRSPHTVALLDVDGMHRLNAEHGHLGGDIFLRVVAHELQRLAEPGDLVARIGGDEFLLLTSCPAEIVAVRLQRLPHTPIPVNGIVVPLRCSVGVYEGRSDLHTALGCADAAMYTAKRCGGGIAVYDRARDGDPPPAGHRSPVRRRDTP
ncbi:GGDEF domain-containing protein [Dactylosporangium sp. NPDC051541]|uniref:GGDEF domain-containing protein n=1 Tax=Dactylosporangium sp. NPDC051541 TaxID=3363977 RepID=UPI0037AD6676